MDLPAGPGVEKAELLANCTCTIIPIEQEELWETKSSDYLEGGGNMAVTD